MRTTVDLPDSLFRELKSVAAKRGVSIKALIKAAVEVEIHKGQDQKKHKLKFPLLPSSEPGTLNLTNTDIEDLLA